MTRKLRITIAFAPVLFAVFNFSHWLIPDSWHLHGEAVDWLVYDSLSHLFGSYLCFVSLKIARSLSGAGNTDKWITRILNALAWVQVLQAAQVWSGYAVKGAWDVALLTIYFIVSAILALGMEAFRRWKQRNRKRIGFK